MNRKILILIPILISTFLFANQTFANNADNITKIEKETQNCLNKGIAMQNCNYKAIEKYQIEIEKTIKKLKKKLTQSQYEKLINSQNKWEEFANANNELYINIFDTIPASVVQLYGSEYKKEIYKNRTKELIELYDEYNNLLKEYRAKKYYQ